MFKKLLMPPFYDPHLIIRNAVCNILRSWVSKLGPCFAGPHKVLKYIQQRLRAGEWPVVLKALLLCHILLDEGSRGIIDLLLHSPFIFNLQEFRDASNPSAFDYSSYTRLFARYIQERIVTIRTLGAFYDTVREPRMNQQTAIVAQESETIPTGQISALEVNQVLKVMPTLENQLDVLTDVRLRAEELHNDLTIGIMERLMKDMLPLVNQLTQGVEVIQENFFTFSKSRCEESLKIYQTYIELVEKANAFLAIGNRLGATESNISLEHAPLDYVKGMEEHIATLSEDGKSSDTTSERRSYTTPKSPQKIAGSDYDEEAALAAAIKASLQESGSSSMIDFDDDSDEEEEEEEIGSDGMEKPQGQSEKHHSIDDFFGLESSNSQRLAANASKQASTTTSSEKPTKKGDDLLDLLGDMSINTPQGTQSAQSHLVPPMPAANRTKSSSETPVDSNNHTAAAASQQQHLSSSSQQPSSWNNNSEMESQMPYQNLQGYYSTVGGMNMMPMFPSQQGMMHPNMMMAPYMTYGGPGSMSSGMPPMGVYPSGMYMQYNSNMGSWNPGLAPFMQQQPQQQMYPNYMSGARIPGTATSPPEYDPTNVQTSGDMTHATSDNPASSQKRVEQRRQDPLFGELNPFYTTGGTSAASSLSKPTSDAQGEKHGN